MRKIDVREIREDGGCSCDNGDGEPDDIATIAEALSLADEDADLDSILGHIRYLSNAADATHEAEGRRMDAERVRDDAIEQLALVRKSLDEIKAALDDAGAPMLNVGGWPLGVSLTDRIRLVAADSSRLRAAATEAFDALSAARQNWQIDDDLDGELSEIEGTLAAVIVPKPRDCDGRECGYLCPRCGAEYTGTHAVPDCDGAFACVCLTAALPQHETQP